MTIQPIHDLEQQLHYTFQNPSLIQEALRHSSYVNEQPEAHLRDNERLEFLGDAVLNLVIGDILMKRHPELKEGELSRMRANLVNETQLARIANALNLGAFILLGKGEIQTNGRQKKSILSDALEAVIAAIYLDGNFDAAYRVIDHHFKSLFSAIFAARANHDYKSQLQEMIQSTYRAVPQYSVIDESGPDHDKTFTVQLQFGEVVTEGVGKSKKKAEQDAARNALNQLKPDEPTP